MLAEKLNLNINPNFLSDYIDPSFIMQSVANTISAFGNVLTNYFLILFIVMFTLLEAAIFSEKLKKKLFLIAANQYQICKVSAKI